MRMKHALSSLLLATLLLAGCGRSKSTEADTMEFASDTVVAEASPASSEVDTQEFKTEHFSIQLPTDWTKDVEMLGIVLFGATWGEECFGKSSFAQMTPDYEGVVEEELASMTIEEHLKEMDLGSESETKVLKKEVTSINGMEVAIHESVDPAQEDIPAMVQRGYIFKKGPICATFNFIAIESCWEDYKAMFEPAVKTIQLF
jgi:hypothetical protein